MNIFEAYKGMYDCSRLPAYAKFLIDNHLKDIAVELIATGRKFNVPLLMSLSARLSEDQIMALAMESTREFLNYIVRNEAYQQLVGAMDKWIRDRLEVIDKLDVTAQDITLINFMRSHYLKKFIPNYTGDVAEAIAIVSEIDRIILGANTTAANIYLEILEGEIAKQSNLATKVIEASPAVTFLVDTKNHKQVFVSGNVCEVLGYSSEEIAQMGDRFLLDYTHPDDLEFLLRHFQQVIADNSNKTKQVEFRFRHKDGSFRWLRTYEVIFRRDEHGNAFEILGKAFEITNEKETALALEKREKQLLEAQSIAHIGSYEWDIEANYSTNTDEVFRIFEMSGEQHYEQFLSYVHPEDVQKVKDAMAQSFVTGFYECEYRYIKNNKEKIIWSIGKVEFENNKPVRMIGTVQDVTTFKKMEHDLLLKSEQLAQTNESLRQFAYVASHDMKEPLRKIMMFSDLVLNAEKGNLSERSVNQLQKMQISGRNLYRMVEDILSFSLLEARETRKRVTLESILREVEELLEEIINQKNAKIIYTSLPEVEVIPSQFRQLFQNLISNSLKFSRPDVPPVIEVKAYITQKPELPLMKSAPRFLELSVEDNGIGFPEEASEKIFELFSRYHAKSQYEGTGLGLSISRRIVDNHDGVIRAYSGSDKGALFRIIIPQS